MTKDESDPTQLWVTSDYGQQLINVGTNLPFQAHEGRSWIWDEEGKVLIDARKPNKVAYYKFIVFNISFTSVSVIWYALWKTRETKAELYFAFLAHKTRETKAKTVEN